MKTPTAQVGRSRAIVVVGVVLLLALGGWIIARRVMPYAFDGVVTGAPSGTGWSTPASSMMGDAVMSYDAVASEAMMEGKTVTSTQSLALTDVAPMPDIIGMEQRRVRKEGYLDVVVADIDATMAVVRTTVAGMGGEVMQSNIITLSDGRMTGSTMVRVPVARFDDAMAALKDLAVTVGSENTSALDVTQEYTDLEARLANKRREEEAYVQILDRAGKIDDVLAVTRQIAATRGEIERMEAQRRYMASQTDFSTVTLTMTEDEKVVVRDENWRPGAVVRESLNRLIDRLQGMVDDTLRFLTFFVPVFLIYLAVLALLWRVGRRLFARLTERYVRRRPETSRE